LAVASALGVCGALHAVRGPSAYPVSRVVQLLQEMKESLENEADTDEEIYEKMACWCTTNDKAKTKSIADAETKLSQLGASIDKLTAESATLQTQIAGLEQEVKKNVDSLETAKALRAKQKADFVAEEKEMVQSISALNSAVVVLSKHHSSAALVSATSVVTQVAKALEHIKSHSDLLQGTITPHQQRALAAFVQGAGGGKAAPYQPASSEIFGILKQMKTTFEADLSESQKEELANQQAFDELKVAKEEEIASGQASLKEKQQNIARADSLLAESKEEREDLEASLGTDQAFLSELKTKCAMTDKEWGERQQMRRDEIASVAEAIGILSSDDAKDLFSKVFNAPSFVQLAAHGVGARKQAVAVLSKLAASDPRLSALATSARLDAFTRVKQAIDEMVAQLAKEAEEEIVHRDSCIKDLNANEKWDAKEVHTKEGLISKLDTLEMQNTTQTRSIEGLQAEVAELETQLERARENRDKEKAEFESTVADQKATQSLLEQALAVIKSRYEAKAEEAMEFVQVHQKGTRGEQAPPDGFGKYEKSTRHANGAVGLLEHIISDSKRLQQESTQAENDAIEAFTLFSDATKASLEAKNNNIIDLKAQRSKTEEGIASTKSELGDSLDELESLTKSRADLKGNCDFFIQNFDIRSEARSQEIESLRQAKAYLSGMQ